MKTTQPMRHAGASYQRWAPRKSEKPSRIERFIEKAQSPEQSSRRWRAARVLGMLAAVGATLTAGAGISFYHESGETEPVVNLLNPVAEHVMTTDEDISNADGLSNSIALEGRQTEEAVMHGVACGTEAMALSSITLYLLNERAHRSSRKKARS